MAATTARFAPRTLAVLVDLLLARRASVARCAEALRIEAADALSRQDLSDLHEHEDPSVDTDASTALMLGEWVERRLWEVEEALTRVADGKYGYCVSCGGGIPLERLRALPATTNCVECSRRSLHGTEESIDRDPRSETIQLKPGGDTSVSGSER